MTKSVLAMLLGAACASFWFLGVFVNEVFFVPAIMTSFGTAIVVGAESIRVTKFD